MDIFRLKTLFLTILLIVMWLSSFGQERFRQERPKVGVVLSGGGAKGIAHVGVLKVLKEKNIPIDYIAGTSMGSLVGAMYAVGYSADSIASILKSVDWDAIMFDKVPRNFIGPDFRDGYEKYLLSFNFDKKFNLTLPMGAVQGMNLRLLMNKIWWNYMGDIDFAELPVPFFCVAADLMSGTQVILDNGNLVDALCASIAIPLVFSPVRKDSMLLVDGGVYNNFPTLEMKQKGADIVIGVNVGFESYSQAELKYIDNVVSQLMWVNNVDNNIRSKTYCNILIEPDVSVYKSRDFDRAEDLINSGINAALENLEYIDSLAAYLHSFNDEVVDYEVDKPVKRVINEVKVNGLDGKEKDVFINNLLIKQDGSYTADEISMDVLRERGDMRYSSVVYNFKSDSILEFDVKKQANDYRVQVGFNFDMYSYGRLMVNFDAGSVISSPIRLNFKGELSRNPSAEVTGLYSLGSRRKNLSMYNSVVSLGLTASVKTDNIYSWNGSMRNSDARTTVSSIKLYMRKLINNYHYFAFGVSQSLYSFKSGTDNSFIQQDIPYKIQESLTKVYYELEKDKLDDSELPTKGSSFSLYTAFQFPTHELSINLSCAISYKKVFDLGCGLYLSPNFSLGVNLFPEIGFSSQFYLGGESACNGLNSFPLYGYEMCEYVYAKVFTAGLDLRWNVHKNHNIMLVSNVGGGIDLLLFHFMDDREPFFGAGAGVGYCFNSFLGPFEVILSQAFESKRPCLWVSFGHHF